MRFFSPITYYVFAFVNSRYVTTFFLKVDMLQKTMKYIHEYLIWLGGSLNQFTGEKHSILRFVYFTGEKHSILRSVYFTGKKHSILRSVYFTESFYQLVQSFFIVLLLLWRNVLRKGGFDICSSFLKIYAIHMAQT